MTSTLESTFDYLLRVLAPDLPEPETEYRFDPRGSGVSTLHGQSSAWPSNWMAECTAAGGTRAAAGSSRTARS